MNGERLRCDRESGREANAGRDDRDEDGDEKEPAERNAPVHCYGPVIETW